MLCKLSPMKCQILFSEKKKIRKNITSVSSAELAERMVMVKINTV